MLLFVYFNFIWKAGRKRSPNPWLTPQMPVVARHDQAEARARTPSAAAMRVAGAQALGSPVACQAAWAGSWVGSRGARTQAGCWGSKWPLKVCAKRSPQHGTKNPARVGPLNNA